MAIIDDSRHQRIKQAVMQRPEAPSDGAVHLWERLAAELVPIIGEGGFQSLHVRSIHLAGRDFPWLLTIHASHSAGPRFESLKANLEGRNAAEAHAASIALLTTFIDILATLIGDLLTASILRSAWGDDVSDIALKEFQ
jgi:hypothetical protein